MKRLCLILFTALLLVACGSDGTTPDPLQYQAHITGQIGGASVDLYVVLEPTGTLPQTPLPATATPSVTLQPSATVTLLPTNTPRPTSTPTGTPTATVTPFPTVSAPTAETTPPPTPIPGPGKVCEAVVFVAAINVRSEPATTATIVSTLRQGQRVEISRFEGIGGYLWANIATGQYFVVRATTGDFWVTFSNNDYCTSLAGWPFGVEPPAEIAQAPTVLIHAVPGANAMEMQQAYAVLRSAGSRYGVKAVNDIGLCRDAHAAGGVCIFRSTLPADCPNVLATDPAREAQRYLLALAPFVAPVLSSADYIELVNECQMDLAYLQTFWNPFLLTAIQLARAWQWPPLVAPTWNPGAPEDWHLDLIKPALIALRDSGGQLGLHAYSIDLNVGLCESNDWLAYRHRRIRMKLDSMGLGGLDIAITEAARGDGNQTVSIADFDCWYTKIKTDAGIDSVALWTAGFTSAWNQANLNGSMVALAQALSQ